MNRKMCKAAAAGIEWGIASFRTALVLSFIGLCIDRPAGHAQSTNRPDPLMVLMQSQPPINTEAPKAATAVFDPPVVRVGDEATYRITLGALLDSISWPEKLPAPEGLVLHPSANGQIFRPLGGTLQPHSAFNQRARSDAPGNFLIPEFTVQAYGQSVTIPAARLIVVPANAIPPQAANRLQLELPLTNVFAGQALNARVRQNVSRPGSVPGLMQVELTGDGVLVDRSLTQQRMEAIANHGTNRMTFLHDTTLIPLRSGTITITAQGFESGNQFNAPNPLPGGLPEMILVDSDPVTITVKPLPKAGELPGFTGGIGNFTLDSPSLSTNQLRVGEPVKLTVTVRGQGNLGRLLPPTPAPTSEWQVFSDNSETPPALIRARGYVSFSYSLIPMSEYIQTTPPLPFSYFDPARARYVDLSIPALRVQVSAGDQPVDAQALALAASPPDSGGKQPRLSELAASPGITVAIRGPLALQPWFPLVQIAPVFGFFGLWAWDQRRRYLAAHPEIRTRRHARRCLHHARRQLRRAVRDGNPGQLTQWGLKAMRAAAAPHCPAEPDALVGTDVLALFNEEERNGTFGDIVRKLFATSDAARYGTHPSDAYALLAMHGDIERMLNRLEEML